MITDEAIQQAFEDFSAPYDLEGDEWLDMDVVEIFRRGYLAGAKAENEACAEIFDECHETLWYPHEVAEAIRDRHATPTPGAQSHPIG